MKCFLNRLVPSFWFVQIHLCFWSHFTSFASLCRLNHHGCCLINVNTIQYLQSCWLDRHSCRFIHHYNFPAHPIISEYSHSYAIHIPLNSIRKFHFHRYEFHRHFDKYSVSIPRWRVIRVPRYLHILHFIEEIPRGSQIYIHFSSSPSSPSFQALRHLRRQRQELFVNVRARSKEAADGWEPGSTWSTCVFFHHKPRWMFFCCFKMGVSWDNGIHDAGGPHIAKLVNITNYDL